MPQVLLWVSRKKEETHPVFRGTCPDRGAVTKQDNIAVVNTMPLFHVEGSRTSDHIGHGSISFLYRVGKGHVRVKGYVKEFGIGDDVPDRACYPVDQAADDTDRDPRLVER